MTSLYLHNQAHSALSKIYRKISGIGRRNVTFCRDTVDALPGLDTPNLPAEDKITFGIGYLTAKIGVPPDFDQAGTEYQMGYDLGKRVASHEVPAPAWDVS